jgi:NADH dehydrogenase [ubiquinone] 1 alpha subcomplex assembly factor 7
MTTLNDIIIRQIELSGPMGLQEYMALALYHPQHGYYRTRDPLGARGDFTTAPEISQMFGEMIGAWVADLWGKAGRPSPFILLECGPGRGTMMADMLRAGRGASGFLEAARVHLLEISPALREKQRQMLRDHDVSWHDSLASVPRDVPLMIVGNEFWDAFPVQQFVRQQGGWAETMVGVRDGALSPVYRPVPDVGGGVDAAPGFVMERSVPAQSLFQDMCVRVRAQGGAMIFIDYGYEMPPGVSTVQALRQHRRHDFLCDPGEADITAHVDFAALKTIARNCGLSVFGAAGQGDFLRRLGIEERARILAAKASDAQKADVLAAIERLTSAQHMGDLFKVMAVCGEGIVPEGFA